MVVYLCLKYSLKQVRGLRTIDGSDYELKLDVNGCVSDESLSEVLQLDASPKLLQAVASLMNSTKDPQIDGVEVILKQGPEGESKKKKQSAQ